jgi:hypothetical protein
MDFASLPQEKEAASLQKIIIIKSQEKLEIQILVSGPFEVKTFELTRPERLVLDFSPVQKVQTEPVYEINDFGIERIRTAMHQTSQARVVLDFGREKPAFQISQTEQGVVIICQKTEALKKRERGETKAEIKPENMIVGISLGAYWVADETYKEVYKSWGAMIGLELYRSFFSRDLFSLGVSLEKKFFSKTGASTVTGQAAKLSLSPFSLEARGCLHLTYVIPFFGLGLNYFPYREESVLMDTSGLTLGPHVQAGAYFYLPRWNFLKMKIYLRFTSAKTTENNLRVNLGGLEAGMGLAYNFRLF